MERTVACLRKALHDKEAPLKLAMTRLEERTRRVDVELCKDPSMIGSVFRDNVTFCFKSTETTKQTRVAPAAPSCYYSVVRYIYV